MNVKWKAGFGSSVNVKDAHVEIERIRSINEGVAAPAVIVNESRPDEAVLHSVFDWNDFTAAEGYRRHQARQLVTAFRIEKLESGESSDVPVYVSVILNEQRGYAPTDLVFEDEEAWRFVVNEALKGLRAWQRRYESIDALSSAALHVSSAITDMEQKS